MTQVALLDTNQEIMISVYVKRDTHENGMTLEEYSDAVIAGTQPILSRDAFAYQFGAIDDVIAVVTDWATANNLTVVHASSAGATVKLSGTAGQFNSLFNIELKSVTDIDRTYYTHDAPLTIPADIDDVVSLILGLDNSELFSHHAVEFNPETFDPQLYPNAQPVTPVDVATAYNLPTGDGYGGCVAILELTYSGYVTGYNTTDVNDSFTRIGLTAPTIVDVLVDGASRSTTSDAESMLDIYCAGAVVPKATLVCYTAPNSGQGFYDAIISAATDVVNNPSAMGISWGGNESSTYLDYAFQVAVAVGLTCFSSTGDSGANGLTTIYPSTSPYQIAAGGTTLYLKNDFTRDVEQAWSGSGGGVSSMVSVPTWQSGLTSKKYSTAGGAQSPVALTNRGVPDVSAPANPNTGYQFYVNGTLVQYGGTSAAAPFLAGMITRLTVLWGKRMSFANTLFYSNTGAFTDITVGNNAGAGTGYIATTGWDAVTGLGVPLGPQLYLLLKTGSTFPKLNHGFRPTYGQGYPRITSGVR